MTAPATRDERSGPFFDALADATLLLRRCRPHRHLSAPEVLFCAECGSDDLEWTPTKGDGHIVTWTAIHTGPDQTGRTSIAAVVGIVELDEGPWLRARLLVTDTAAVRSGATVALEVIETESEPIYAFRPTG
jgi:hypothetical protein